MRPKKDSTKSINLFHCYNNSISLKKFEKLVNAGGYDEIDVHSTSRGLRFMEDMALLGWGDATTQNLVRHAIATSTPALTNILKMYY